MLAETGSKWCATCSRCLTTLPPTDTKDGAIAAMSAETWELDPESSMCWCLTCSREMREVQFRPTARGQRRRRR